MDKKRTKLSLSSFLVGAGGFTLRVKFVRYANRRILCPSRLRQGEPTRDGQRGSNPPYIPFKLKKNRHPIGCLLFLAVTNNLDATLFFEKRAKISYFLLFFKKYYLFDKLEFVQ